MFRDDEDTVENTEFQPVAKVKTQRTTWSKNQLDDDANYHYILPNVRIFSLITSYTSKLFVL